MRPRCRLCRKVSFADREAATKAAYRVDAKLGQHRMRVYRGSCGRWHLSSLKTAKEILVRIGRVPFGPQMPSQERRA